MFGGVSGQFGGGESTYFSEDGSVDFTKACFTSHVLGILPRCTASATKSRRSCCDITGAKVSDFSHW